MVKFTFGISPLVAMLRISLTRSTTTATSTIRYHGTPTAPHFSPNGVPDLVNTSLAGHGSLCSGAKRVQSTGLFSERRQENQIYDHDFGQPERVGSYHRPYATYSTRCSAQSRAITDSFSLLSPFFFFFSISFRSAS